MSFILVSFLTLASGAVHESVLDSGLSADDCAAALVFTNAAHPETELACVLDTRA